MNLDEIFKDLPTKNKLGFKSMASLFWTRVVIAISPVREFFEASTLHGLVYVSKAESCFCCCQKQFAIVFVVKNMLSKTKPKHVAKNMHLL